MVRGGRAPLIHFGERDVDWWTLRTVVERGALAFGCRKRWHLAAARRAGARRAIRAPSGACARKTVCRVLQGAARSSARAVQGRPEGPGVGAGAASGGTVAKCAKEIGMIVYQLTLVEFLACPGGPSGATTTGFLELYPDVGYHPNTEIVLAINPGFATAPALHFGGLANELLLERCGTGWQVVGGYIETNLLIEPRAKGKKLSRELILRCSEHRPRPSSRQLTVDGCHALSGAHRFAVSAAVRAGLDVPRDVRNYYGF